MAKKILIYGIGILLVCLVSFTWYHAARGIGAGTTTGTAPTTDTGVSGSVDDMLLLESDSGGADCLILESGSGATDCLKLESAS